MFTLADKQDENTPPLIILEEAEYLQKLKEFLAKKLSRQIIYLVTTYANNPVPVVDDKISKYERNEPENWKIFREKLKEIGVKKILLGGMNFDMDENLEDWTRTSPYVDQCVGIALSYLSEDKGGEFPVKMSALTAPFSKRRAFADFKRKNKK